VEVFFCKVFSPLSSFEKLGENKDMTVLIFLGILLSLASAQTGENELTFYVVKSPHGLNWDSPSKAIYSIQKNRLLFSPRPLGTVFTEIHCKGESELRTTSFETLDLFNQLVLNQEGLGVFFHSFPGRMESDNSLRDELAGYMADGKVNFITFALNQGQCARAQNYLQEYEDKKISQNWGLSNIPRKGEGGNSLAFAVSILEVLGFNEEIFKEGWMRSLRVPIDLVGKPREDRSIIFFKILGSEWAAKLEPYHLLSFWDPEIMHEWISRNLKNFPKTKKASKEGIFLDRKHFPTLSTPFWLPQDNLEP
jgi:hypothetical protein